MKTNWLNLTIVIGTTCLLCGCGDSDKGGTTSTETPASASTAAPDATRTAAAAVESVKTAASEIASQFVSKAKAEADKQLGSIATDLVSKVQSLGESTGIADSIKTQLDSTLQSLLGGQDSAALNTAYKLAEAAKLTPEQMGLAKEVGNLASAFVVQRNFSALDGAQGDVAAIVSSLRNGDLTSAIPAIQKVAQNANLTAIQKDLIGDIVNKYAPGLKNATDSLQQGLQKLPGLSK